MDSKNILNEKSLFIVGILDSGGSLNSFLRILHAYFQERATPLPRLMFLNLTQDMNWGLDKRRSFSTFEQTGQRTNKGVLTLLPFPGKNIKEFRIEAYSVPIFEKTINDMLDQDMFKEFWWRESSILLSAGHQRMTRCVTKAGSITSLFMII